MYRKPAYKPFSNSLYNKYDEPARAFVKKIYNDLGIIAQDNPDKYGIDLILYKDNNKIGYAEVECCASWNMPIYPYKSLHVPIRKEKFFKLDLPSEYWQVSNTFSRALHIDGEQILKSPVIVVPNKYVLSNERFYDVELNIMSSYNRGLMISREDLSFAF